MIRQLSMTVMGLWMMALWAGSILEGAAQEMGPDGEGSSNDKFVVTATCKVGDADHYAPFFDQSLKTFSPQ